MKVLIVCSYNNGRISPFISEQVDSINKQGIDTEYFLIRDAGVFGYLKSFPKLKKKIKEYQPDLIHAHYGLSGLLSVLQRKIPVVTTFHGDDINLIRNWFLSIVAISFSKKSIVVSRSLRKKVFGFKTEVIPCGVDVNLFSNVSKKDARKKIKLDFSKDYILFSSSFNRPEKNYQLAKKALLLLKGRNVDVELLELKGYSRKQVSTLFSAVDVALLTSIREGSPQFIKEAMAANCPIVSTDIGDAKWVIGNTIGCSITGYSVECVAEKIISALEYGQRTNGKHRIIELGIDSETVAKKIINIYNKILEK